ncbi:transmembrane protein, putative (macronuclear) [Tetrahymena thermophila SB210]|uniref:Transmembrane protein, putative n=1 Tax=Tetrahymena thermophila (strain SB210) TaxID=312017 RepID=Q245V4_TETTS|nr:transmembrane protein, putative [Tetrahymena thermophila SB210]EAS03529.2 transmembrane protein, putative [Tetrahymena thermophila SB210]|eukprot:XP_001023774.2 transmembrane protein, putative [Tetrahymena thermophila SB210]
MSSIQIRNILLFLLVILMIKSIAKENLQVDLQESIFPRDLHDGSNIAMKNSSGIAGEFKKVYFLYLYGATSDDIDPLLPAQSVFNTTHRANSPFLRALNQYLRSEPQNSFYKRVQVNGVIEDQFNRIQHLMTGSEISQLIYDIQVADPLSYFKDLDEYFQKKSIIDQILALKNVNFTEGNSIIQDSFQGFSLNDRKILLSKRFYTDKYEDRLNSQNNISKLRKNSTSYVNNTKNIQAILNMMIDGKQDVILAYDDTLAKIKKLFDEKSVQVFNIYHNLNDLLQSTIQKISNDTLLIVMGENSNQNKQSAEESKNTLGKGESFLFAYSKQGFDQSYLMDEIDSAEQRNKLIRQSQLNRIQISEDGEDDSEANLNNYHIFNSNQNKTNQKRNYTFYDRNPSDYIQDQSIASTLSFLLGFEIPASNNGRNILQLMPKTLQNDDDHLQNKIVMQLFENSYQNLLQQITLLNQLQEDYDFFTQESLKKIDKKYQQILSNQNTVNTLIKENDEISKLYDEKVKILQKEENKMNSLQIQQAKEEINNLEQKLQSAQSLLKAHFALIIDLQDYLYHLLSGDKSITTGLTIAYIFIYASTFLFALRQFFKQMTNLYDNQKEKIAYLTKQLSVILPLTVLGYYVFYLYSAKTINESVAFICVAVFSCLFLFEVIYLRQKLDLPKLFLNITALYFASNKITTEGLATVGFWLHLFLRLRYGTAYKDFQSKKQILIAIVIFFVGAFRLVTFNIDSPFIDALLILIVVKNQKIKYSDKLCFVVLIITQYMFNFTDSTQEEIGQYLIFGCSTFLIVIIIQLYESISLTLSFNKFFITNIIFIYFLNILIDMRKPLNNNDQLVCCLIFYLPSYILMILTEKDSFQQIQQFIVRFVKHQTQIKQKAQTQEEILIELKEVMLDLESQTYTQKAEDQNKINISSEEQQKIEQIQPNNNKTQTNNKEDSSDHKSISSLWHINLNNFGIYTLSGVLQLLIIMISFSQIFSDQYLLNPTLITHSKIGLIQYSILQYLIALLCILISNQLKKSSISVQAKSENTEPQKAIQQQINKEIEINTIYNMC